MTKKYIAEVDMQDASQIAPENRHHGSFFADFLAEKGVLDEVESEAINRVIAWESVSLSRPKV